jgi:hypothetical protein
MKIDQVFDDKHKPWYLHRADCKHRGAGGNGSDFRKATLAELRTLPECSDCARQARKL